MRGHVKLKISIQSKIKIKDIFIDQVHSFVYKRLFIYINIHLLVLAINIKYELTITSTQLLISVEETVRYLIFLFIDSNFWYTFQYITIYNVFLLIGNFFTMHYCINASIVPIVCSSQEKTYFTEQYALYVKNSFNLSQRM